ncbi:unnamed protein product, partial [Scytosiphon promiscuus]
VVLFLFVLVLYIYTAMPSVPGGDAGELLAEGCHLGSPHPPGYPLLNIIYFSLSRLPLPSMLPPTVCADSTPATVSWAANMLSGGFGSVTAVLASLTVEEWTRASPEAYNVGAAAAASLMFSLSPLAWEYNTGSEVFSLNNVLVAASAYLTV